MRTILSFALFGLLAVEGLSSSARAEKFAVVVGVNDCPAFQLPDGSRPKPLRGAEADADAVAERLVAQFGFARDQVRLLKGPQATLTRLRETLAEVARRANAGDQVVFHFSGHGTQVADRRPWDEADELDEALCLADTNSSGDNVLVDDELGLWLDDLKATNVTVLLDCCHAGSGTKDLDSTTDGECVPRFLAMPAPAARPTDKPESAWRELASGSKSLGRRTTALFACQASQQAYERRLPGVETPGGRAGQFTHFLLDGLADNKADVNRDGVITSREALDYTRQRLDESFNRTRSRSVDRQEPQLDSDSDTEPLFGTTAKR